MIKKYAQKDFIEWEDFTVLQYNGYMTVLAHVMNKLDTTLQPIQLWAEVYDKDGNLLARGRPFSLNLPPKHEANYSAYITSPKLNKSDSYIVIFKALGTAGASTYKGYLLVETNAKEQKTEKIFNQAEDFPGYTQVNNSPDYSKYALIGAVIGFAILVAMGLLKR